MPAIDGFTVRTEVASRAQTRHIPIVVIIAVTDDLRRLDVTWLLRKPVTPEGTRPGYRGFSGLRNVSVDTHHAAIRAAMNPTRRREHWGR